MHLKRGVTFMEIKDFVLFRDCDGCGEQGGFYYMPMSDDKYKRIEEVEEHKQDLGMDFYVNVLDGSIRLNCKCGCIRAEVPFEQWTAEECSSVLGDLLEDNNRHNITDIGRTIINCMKSANVNGMSDEIKKEFINQAMRNLLKKYSDTQSLHPDY